jgi:hypothetical protein
MQVEHPGLARLVRELLTRIESGDSEAQGAPEQEADGVRLLTTHKAKGLEFDTVIVPDTAADLRGPGGGVLREWPATPDEPLGIWLRSTDEDSLGESQCDLAGYFAKTEADQRGDRGGGLLQQRDLVVAASGPIEGSRKPTPPGCRTSRRRRRVRRGR